MKDGARFSFSDLKFKGKMMSKNNIIIAALVIELILCTVLCLAIIGNRNPVINEISESHIKSICELATLKCFYHNVSEWNQDGYGLADYGKKRIWIEYDGIITAGINGDYVDVSEPNSNNTITVTVPDAKILSCDLDENSIEEIDQTTSVAFFFTDEITPEDRVEAIAQAQANMKKSAEGNLSILDEAKSRAKFIIEEMIVRTGKLKGEDYNVRFADVGENKAAPETTKSPE